MHPVVAVSIVAAAVGIIATFVRATPTFIVDIKDGKATAISGKIPAGFLRDCDDVVSLYKIPAGRIKAFVSGDRVSLRFSKSIPAQYHQNFRNIWHANRW